MEKGIRGIFPQSRGWCSLSENPREFHNQLWPTCSYDIVERLKGCLVILVTSSVLYSANGSCKWGFRICLPRYSLILFQSEDPLSKKPIVASMAILQIERNMLCFWLGGWLIVQMIFYAKQGCTSNCVHKISRLKTMSSIKKMTTPKWKKRNLSQHIHSIQYP